MTDPGQQLVLTPDGRQITQEQYDLERQRSQNTGRLNSLLSSPVAAGVYGATGNDTATGITAALEQPLYGLGMVGAGRASAPPPQVAPQSFLNQGPPVRPKVGTSVDEVFRNLFRPGNSVGRGMAVPDEQLDSFLAEESARSATRQAVGRKNPTYRDVQDALNKAASWDQDWASDIINRAKAPEYEGPDPALRPNPEAIHAANKPVFNIGREMEVKGAVERGISAARRPQPTQQQAPMKSQDPGHDPENPLPMFTTDDPQAQTKMQAGAGEGMQNNQANKAGGAMGMGGVSPELTAEQELQMMSHPLYRVVLDRLSKMFRPKQGNGPQNPDEQR